VSFTGQIDWEFRKVGTIGKRRIEAGAAVAKEMWNAEREDRPPRLTQANFPKATLVRHVALRKDGSGATFVLEAQPISDQQQRWRWYYDPSLASQEVHFTVAVNRALYYMDRALDRVDGELLAPLVRPDGTRVSDHKLVGYGPEDRPDLPGWPWAEDPDQSTLRLPHS
jgi:hypothetical protein